MKITAQEEYGLRCLLQIARSGSQTSLSIADIAEKEGISTPYAAKLLSMLRQTGFIDSTLGRSGGYKLAKPAREMGLGSVFKAIGERLFEEEEFCQKHAGTETEGACVHHDNCNLRSLWTTLEGCIQHILDGLTIADLLHNNNDLINTMRQRLVEPRDTDTSPAHELTPLMFRERIIDSPLTHTPPQEVNTIR